MPELPEAETIARQLQRLIAGRTIGAVKVTDRKVAHGSLRKARGKKISGVGRRGKAVIIKLDSGESILARLGMTGHFSFADAFPGTPSMTRAVPYAAACIGFTDGSSLTYHSIRRFERIQLLTQKALEEELHHLGPEPLDRKWTLPHFIALMHSCSHGRIKPLLMDQSKVAGIGNIYAQEALYRAGILPQRRVGTLSQKELSRSYYSLRGTLREAIRRQGTSSSNYLHLDGMGSFQNFLCVYGKERCPRRHAVKRQLLSGRGTYFCSQCQK